MRITSLAAVLLLPVFAAAATVDGVPIHSTTHGTGPKTLIFVHGWTCDETSWREQVPAFEKGYRMITLDLPGHGQSGAPKDAALSMVLFARAVEAVRAEAGADKVVLVGHSMGTPVIRHYARLFADHVAALVAVDGPLHFSGRPAGPITERLRGPNGMKNREAMIRNMFSAATTAGLQADILKMMLAPPESTATQAMAAMFTPNNWTKEVMRFPVLAIFADHSTENDPKYMKKIWPNSQGVEVPGTGHFLMMEKPAEFNRLLQSFLTKLGF